jgi:putative phage-type endonuclease
VSPQDWHEWRRNGLGGSDIAALVGLSPWASPWSIWAEKVGLVHDDSDNEWQEFGRRIEPVLVRWFEDRTGLHIAGEQMWLEHPDQPWRRCTADGLVFDGHVEEPSVELALAGFEGKSTGDPPSKWEADGIPLNYQCQGQWSMGITGLPRWYFGVLHGRQFRVYVLERDDADIATLVAAAEKFWPLVLAG